LDLNESRSERLAYTGALSNSSCGYIPAAHEVVLRGGSLWFFRAYLWSVIAWTVAVSICKYCLDVIMHLSPKRRYPSADRRSVRRTGEQLNSFTCPASDFIELAKRGLGVQSVGITEIRIIILY